MSEYFPKPKSLGSAGKIKLDLSNYRIKSGLKNATDANTLDFAKNTVWAHLKSNLVKLDIDKLKNVPSNELM